jgi:hypothetical protein
VFSGFFAPPAKLLELDFFLHRFAILAAPIINPLASSAGEFD